MAKKVNIKCRYYQVREMQNGEVTENLYDLREWISEVLSKTLLEKYKEVNNIKGRLEHIVRFGTTEMYAMNFMRMDEISTSFKLKIGDPAEHIDIDVNDDEYIAKNTVCLYDANSGILMVQCNRGSFSEKSIQSYINSFFTTQVCCLLPIIENINLIGDNVEYMKIDVRLANLREFVPTQNSGFERIINGMNRVNGTNAHLEISLGDNRNARLNNDEVRIAIADLMNNRGCVSSAKIKLSDDQVAGIYDLFDNLSNDIIKCAVDTDGGISFERLANSMYYRFVNENARNRVLTAVVN